MATLAPASSEFVEALRRGLEAYDAGDNERASHLFDEALEIEPDNVWGLLWKGATSPTVGESKMWLEQAIAMDAHNEHARAGLKWANEQLSGAADETLSMVVVTQTPVMEPVEELDSPTDEISDEVADETYDWLTGGATTSSEELQDFASLLEETADDDYIPAAERGTVSWDDVGVTADDVADVVLSDDEIPDPLAYAAADELPDWLAGDEPVAVADSDTFQASNELPDWLAGDDTATATAEVDEAAPDADGLPDWFAGDDSTATVEVDEATPSSDGLPDWLAGDDTATVDSAESDEFQATSDLPDWLAGDTVLADRSSDDEAQTVAELPDWLTSDEPSGTLTVPTDVADEPADLPDWLTSVDEPVVPVIRDDAGDLPDWLMGDGGTTTDGAAPDLSQPADLPDWLVDDVPTSATSTELPDWLTMEDTPPPPVTAAKTDEAQPAGADLPDWLLGDGTAERDVPAATNNDLPDWLLGDSTTTIDDTATDTGLPDWLTGEPSTPATGEADLPDWLTGAGESPKGSDLPNWLEGETAAPSTETVGELPTWLLGDDSTPFQASRGQGSLAPSDEVVEAYQAGLWAYEEDRLDDATRAFQRVIRLDPTHVEAHNYLGSVFYLNGRQDDAIIALRRALELDPDHSESYLNLGLVYKETGRNPQAVQMFNRYLDLAPPDDTTTEYVREMIGQMES